MKNFWTVCGILAFFMLIIPMLGVGGSDKFAALPNGDTSSLSASGDTFRVLLTDSGQIEEIPESDYICGVVAAEMGPSCGTEALKAQAVASYTYACVMREQERKAPTESMKGADITDNGSIHQRYYTNEQLREKWGDSYDGNYAKIKAAVDAVTGEIIVYEGKPILAAFHAISTGKTESSDIVWNTSVPYLASVNSGGDILSPSYISVSKISPDELKNKLKESGIVLNGEPDKWLGKIEKSDAGTVTSIKVGNKKLSGQKLRSILGLRSGAFDVEYENGMFTFTVYGFGHCVGMSQYGAEYMAQQGADYREILKHYYTGVDIISLSASDTQAVQPSAKVS